MKRLLLFLFLILSLTACIQVEKEKRKPEVTPVETDSYYDEAGVKWIWEDNIRWSREDNVLRIAGEGKLKRKHLKTVWSHWSEDITKVIIEEGIKEIGEKCFSNRVWLREIQLPAGVNKIHKEAFSECVSLEKVNIKQGVLDIGEKAFQCCRKLKKINLPEGIIKIEHEAFADCSSLTSITLPKSLQNYNKTAISGCEKLSKIENNSLYDWEISKEDMMEGIWVKGNTIPAGETITIKPQTYRITYDLNGGKKVKELPNSYQHTKGANPSDYVKKKGYELVCWRNAEGLVLGEDCISPGTTGDTHLIACWMKLDFKVVDKNHIKLFYDLDSGDSVNCGPLFVKIKLGDNYYRIKSGEGSIKLEDVEKEKRYDMEYAIYRCMDEQAYEFVWEYDWRSVYFVYPIIGKRNNF